MQSLSLNNRPLMKISSLDVSLTAKWPTSTPSPKQCATVIQELGKGTGGQVFQTKVLGTEIAKPSKMFPKEKVANI